MRTIVFITIGLIVISIQSLAQTHIPAGNVSGTWTTAASPYIIDGEITIEATNQLEIEPGVDIEFSGHYKFIVQGQLLAIGTETDTIYFKAQDSTGWHGLRFEFIDYNTMDSSRIAYCEFTNGYADGINLIDSLGGVMHCLYSSKLTVEHTKFKYNYATRAGGAVYLDHSPVEFNHCNFEKNEIPYSGLPICYGGGAGIYADESNLFINNSYFYRNLAFNHKGGAICIRTQTDNTLTIKNSVLRDNKAEYGAGICTLDGDTIVNLFMENVSIHWNSGGYTVGSGAIAGRMNFAFAKNVRLFKNDARFGAILIENSPNCIIQGLIIYYNSEFQDSACGGINIRNCENLEIRNVTFYKNHGFDIKIVSNDTLYSSVNITNCIVVRRDGYPEWIKYDPLTSDVTVSYSNIQGGYDGIGNIDVDPLMKVDPWFGIWDFSLIWDDFPEPNTIKSPCIDTGDPIYIDPDGTRSDMGAIPYDQTYTPLTFGDLSGTLTCAGSPYYIYGDQTVPVGEELIIEPCVYVIFQGPYKLRVEGRLIAEGTENNNISFYSADSITGWGGVQFYNQYSNEQDSSIMKDCRVMYGKTNGYGHDASGGGISFVSSSDVRIESCLITKNRANDYGGGIYANNSHPLLLNNIISQNEASLGGGIYGYACQFMVKEGYIENNQAESGGGIYLQGNSPEFSSVTIRDNLATEFGGGICLITSADPVFSSTERCNIYDNFAYKAGTDICGKDLYSSSIDLFIDEYTVSNPDDHFIYPNEKFNVDILLGKYIQHASDLYVSPTGDNTNSGLTPSNPLNTIHQALVMIEPNPLDTFTVYLEGGTYSNSTIGEMFPLNFRSNVALVGNEGETVILDGEDTTNFFYFYDDQNCTLKNIQMKNGEAEYGGAVYVENQSTPRFENLIITNCNADLDGGGVYATDESYPTFHGVTFSGNSGRYGGALMCNSSNAKLYNVGFTGNAGYEGGAINTHICEYFEMDFGYLYKNVANTGGGCEIYRTDTVKISSTIFEQNDAINQYGGGMYIQQSDISIEKSRFNMNSAKWYGGAISFYQNVNLKLNNVQITNDTASKGGGIYGNLWSTLSLKNTLLYNNRADSSNSFDAYGGAMYLWDVETEIINSTITNNSAFDGAAGIYLKTGNLSLKNSIIWHHLSSGIYNEAGTTSVEYSNIEGGWTGTGNLDIDPEFYNFDDNDFSLNEISPCINAGTPDTTGLNLPERCLAGNPRIGGGTIDMGAYEFYERDELDLTVFLEGPWNGAEMNTDLNGNPELVEGIPLSQPYGTTPWNYIGSENVAAIPNTNIVDWMLIELHDAADANSVSPSTIMGTYASFLISDGSIVGLDGSSFPLFSNSATQQLYVVLKHRNHLGILSASPLTESGDIYSFDFTSPLGQAYGTDAQQDLGEGVFGMYAGDADANGIIELPDKTMNWRNEATLQGYKTSDFDLDGQVNNKDKNDYWIPNLGQDTQVPE